MGDGGFVERLHRLLPWAVRPARLSPFRGANLNAVGWAAVAGVCLVGAALGYAAGRLARLPTGVGPVAGAVGSFVAIVVVERRSWGRGRMSLGWGDDPEVIERAGDYLRRRGVDVQVQVDADGQPLLRCHNRDLRQVRRALSRAAGVPVPPLW